MKKILVITFLLTVGKIYATDLKYPVSQIPADLKINVNAVIRDHRQTFRILSQDHVKTTYYKAITIFSEKGKEFAQGVISYDKFEKVTKIAGAVYSEDGSLIKKLKSSEITDRSYYDGNLFNEIRLKIMNLSQTSYPYTVEFEYEVDHKYLYSFGEMNFVPDEKISVERASYQLIYPPALKPRIKILNINNESVTEKISPDAESMLWKYENLKPITFESLGPAHESLLPKILLAPNEFEYAGYVGNMSSWEEYGKWNLLLNHGRDQLSEETRAKVHALTKGLTTDEEKAKVLYEFMQGRTRYVYIQLGIGGLQPFDALVVDKEGYGDCKALSNYMVALLKEAGIKGYYTTIRAGENEEQIMLDFPSHQFNHAIVAVPNGADTLWLECTSQTNPFGYQGTFTGGRKGLMITEAGGKMVNTTKYKMEQNTQVTTAEVFVEKTGNAKAKIKTVYAGLQYENHGLDGYLGKSFDEQKKWIQKNTSIPNFDVVSCSMINQKNKIPSAVVSEDVTLNRYATITGKRLFLTPNLMNVSNFVPEKTENRKSNVFLGMTYVDYDTIKYHIPEEYYAEYLPEDISIVSQFGDYSAGFRKNAGEIIYFRRISRKKGEFSAGSYNDMIEFYKKVAKADHTKIAFLNRT